MTVKPARWRILTRLAASAADEWRATARSKGGFARVEAVLQRLIEAP